MPTISSSQPAKLHVPAGYVEDVRSALAALVADDARALQTADPGDREWGAQVLQRHTRLLGEIQAAAGDVDLTAVHDRLSAPLIHMLEAMVRQQAERLSAGAVYGPVPMGDVADIAERLQWAAREAVRLEPSLAWRLNANEWARAVA